MKRWLLIGIAAVMALSVAGMAGVYFVAPQLIFAAPDKVEESAHSVGKAKDDQTRSAGQGDAHVEAMMRELAAVQDQAAYGNRDVVSEQHRLLLEIGSKFQQFDADAWGRFPNFRTALVYVLSGGEPTVLAPALENAQIGDEDKKLGRGVMNFALGQTKAARAAFKGIDARSLDTVLVGPFALAQASLYMEKDAEAAVRILDEARLAAPHTAIEEAAVRREIPLLVKLGSMARAKSLVPDYVRRYGKSIYAAKLFREFADAVAKAQTNDDVSLVAELAESLQGGDDQIKSALFIDLAAATLPPGRLRFAKAAASHILDWPGAAGEDVARAKLYIAAADAPSERSLAATAALQQIKSEELSDEDVGIKEVAGFVARVVTGNALSNATATSAGDVRGAMQPVVSSAIADADGTVEKAATLVSGSKQ